MAASAEIVLVRLQSAAIFSIFEQYQRRSDTCPVRLVGAILGSVAPLAEEPSASGTAPRLVAEVRHCFPIPHSEVGDQVSINSDYYRSRIDLHRKCYTRDSALLGWYSIQQQGVLPKNMDEAVFARNAEFIGDSFARETGSAGAPVTLHLEVAIAADGAISYRVSCCDSITARSQSAVPRVPATPIASEIAFGVPELYSLDAVRAAWMQGRTETLADGKLLVALPTLSDYQQKSQQELEHKLAALTRYLGEVRAGREAEDPALCTKIAAVLAALGLDENSSDQRKALLENQTAFRAVVHSLSKHIDVSDQLLLSQSYTS